MIIPLTGLQYEIEAGDYRATVTELGAGLRELAYRGQPVIAGYEADQLPPAAAGQLLAPWPNRIDGGRYVFGGTEYQLALAEPARGRLAAGGRPRHPVRAGRAGRRQRVRLPPAARHRRHPAGPRAHRAEPRRRRPRLGVPGRRPRGRRARAAGGPVGGGRLPVAPGVHRRPARAGPAPQGGGDRAHDLSAQRLRDSR